MTRHFLQLGDLTAPELYLLLQRAEQLKNAPISESLRGKTLAMIFNKPSTRTRVAVEAGMAQLGGHALFLAADSIQLGRGEPLADTARVLASMVDGVLIRAHEHSEIVDFAAHSNVPVINALSAHMHPCQLLADLLTWYEHHGGFDAPVAWVGDGNNMCNSWLEAAALLEFEMRVACPEGFEPDAELMQRAGATLERDVRKAVRGAAVVNTDTWVSMGDGPEREQHFEGFQVTEQIMAEAAKNALFMHCLPAYRGKEVDSDIIDAPCSVVWQQAENRLHTHKALLEFLLL